jgi:hypothetical protein
LAWLLPLYLKSGCGAVYFSTLPVRSKLQQKQAQQLYLSFIGDILTIGKCQPPRLIKSPVLLIGVGSEIVTSEIESRLYHLSIYREKVMMQLPPGPQTPAFIQLTRWIFSPMSFMDECVRRFGDMYTLNMGKNNLVFVSNPEALQQLLTQDTRADFHAPGDLNDLHSCSVTIR